MVFPLDLELPVLPSDLEFKGDPRTFLSPYADVAGGGGGCGCDDGGSGLGGGGGGFVSGDSGGDGGGGGEIVGGEAKIEHVEGI